ncbi:hypothetical protein NO995_14515 [Aestuariibaculum sp. M13]|uniref:LVIVD repeat-containing protein n=1 Tax=Aestuariibaculum sp. M13 TaxID=2967132 RepID=UPI002159EDD8|nr:hypothetical protein [Aestuariibaculum sp. M13]MCR8668898.1 hypothetical protein [Aestuariibaculum sp. M13]
MRLKYLFPVLVAFLVFTCDSDKEGMELVQVATPEIMSKAEFRKMVEVTKPCPMEEIGKIYAYRNYIFIGEVDEGIHVIDNSNPVFPKKIKFIKIPKNEDVSVKDDILYADSASDLLAFDISDLYSIKLIERLEDVFDIYNYDVPLEAQRIEYANFNYETDVIVGWKVSSKWREKIYWEATGGLMNDAFSGGAESTTGVGGSLARFQIVDNYLYAVGRSEMSIFNIQELSAPTLEVIQSVGWNIETMFHVDNYLYLGSTNGMYIYSLNEPVRPEYVSEFIHWQGCDPVVVDGNYAYLTLRGGNFCGQLESVLEVIDVSDKSNPELAARYSLDNPYGLGIKDDVLYVCDGTSGLKLFDKSDPLNLNMLGNLKDIQSKDVIPLENSLLMIGGNTLYQYEYLENGVKLISAFSLN